MQLSPNHCVPLPRRTPRPFYRINISAQSCTLMHRNVCLHLPVSVSERLYHFPPTKVLASLLGTERHRTVLKFSNVYTHTHTHIHTTFSRQVNGSYCFLCWVFLLFLPCACDIVSIPLETLSDCFFIFPRVYTSPPTEREKRARCVA